MSQHQKVQRDAVGAAYSAFMMWDTVSMGMAAALPLWDALCPYTMADC